MSRVPRSRDSRRAEESGLRCPSCPRLLSVRRLKNSVDSAAVRKLPYSISSTTEPHAFARWRDNLSEVIDTSRPDEHEPGFDAYLSAASVGNALFMETGSDAQIMVRSPQLIRANECDYLSIGLMQAGEHRADQDGMSVILKPGDIVLSHQARPSSGAYSSFKSLRLHLPRSMAPAFMRYRDVNGVVLNGARPGTRLLAHHVEGLWDCLEDLTATEIQASVEAAFLIASGNLQANAELLPDHRAAIGRTIRRMIQSFVDERLDDPRLGPDTVCRAFHISRSKLYRLFDAEGGVVSYITARRLDRCWELLRTRGREAGPIGSLAYAYGFGSEASFSRAFRRRFGASARDVRDSLAPLRPGSAGHADELSAQTRIMGWYRNLAVSRHPRTPID